MAGSTSGTAASAQAPRHPSKLGMVAIAGVSLYPFVAFLDANQGEVVPLLRLSVYALLTAAVALVGYVMAVRFTRAEPARVAVPVVIVILSFFSFSRWLDPEPLASRRLLQLGLWIGITAAFAIVLYRLSRGQTLRTWVLFFAIFLPAVPAIPLVINGIDGGQAATAFQSSAPTIGEIEDPPNIYYFVLDFYARSDQLRELVDYDNSWFVDALEQRDFAVARSAVGSYPVTGLSIPSTLEMDYIATEPADMSDGIASFNDVLRGDNQVVSALKAAGYEFVYSPNGTFHSLDCSHRWADVCIPPNTDGFTVDDFTQQVLELTPVGSFNFFNQPFTDPVYVVDQLQQRPPRSPFFLFAHVISPHPPYRYEEDCTRRARSVERLSMERSEEQQQYATEVECISNLMVEALDEILAEDPGAMVIVQSDHGSEFLTNWYGSLDQWSDEALAERYSVLDALRLPDGCASDVVDDTSLVNTFRIVFGCLEGEEPDLLPYRAFLFRWEADHDLEEIPVERLDLDGS